MTQTELELIFKSKAEATNNILLYSQWDTEKREIIKALDAISIFFPHYSLHNASHSISILNNITRILGIENLQKMSTVDLWLIVMAAYSHDLGMVVSAKDITEILDGKDFLSSFEKIQRDSSHPLKQYTDFFKVENGKLFYTIDKLSLMQHDAFKFLLSDYFRQNHGKRVPKIIKSYSINTTPNLSIVDHRNNIPTRLYEILCKVCSVHTSSFDEVLSLPFAENGMNTETAHPRFIACLLRLGDVLDVDNHRFSDPSLMTLTSTPKDTQAHIKKHADITHLRIDRKIIEICAICKDPKVAHVTKQWFDWIKKEFDSQVTNWNNIVPDSDFGFLPTVNRLDAILEDYIIPEIPAFTIDTPKALKLLRGTNIYSSYFDAIRELLQNAIDSMLIRLWLDNEKDFEKWSIPDLVNKINTNSTDDNWTKNAEWTRIEIELKKENNDDIIFSIKDYGTGIDFEDLKYLSSPGSSMDNTRKREIARKMPTELSPSGIFGIGFQSVFLLTDKVEIKTKSYFSDEQLKITMHSPTSESKGDIYVKKIPLKDERFAYGTTLSFILDTDMIKDEINPEAVGFIDTYNLLNEKINSELSVMDDSSFFNLIYNKNKLKITKDRPWQYLPNSKVEISSDSLEKLYFKNIKVYDGKSTEYREDSLIESYIKNFRQWRFNIHGMIANELLNISRNTTKSKYNYMLKELIHNSLIEYINTKGLDGHSDNKLAISRFVHFYNLEPRIDKSVKDILNLFQNNFQIDSYSLSNNLNFDYEYIKQEIDTSSFFKKESNLSIEVIDYGYRKKINSDTNNTTKTIIKNDEKVVLSIDYVYNVTDKDIFTFYLKEVLIEKVFYIAPDNNTNSKEQNLDEKYIYTEKLNRVSKTNIEIPDKIENYKMLIFEFKSMFFLPIIKDFKKLRILKNVFRDMDSFYYFKNNSSFVLSLDVMLIPYSKSKNKLDENYLNDNFYRWVQENLKQSLAIDEIKELYTKALSVYK